ncbi:MAG: thiamine pyrophosphate-binding protein, partial [Ottowia sp.]|nr:thiamine pyrophosphate-binding protein [Ottowia sp.]
DSDIVPFDAGKQAHREWLEWSTPTKNGAKLDLGMCISAMQAALPADAILCNGSGNFAMWWHRYWHFDHFPAQLTPACGAMGYGVPAAVAAAMRFPDRCVVALAGDGDFLMNGQELATAAQYGCDMLVIVVDNGGYGTIRMHQERSFPGRVSATELKSPDFAALARGFGAWATRVETTEDFAPALAEAQERKGLRLLHLVTEME